MTRAAIAVDVCPACNGSGVDQDAPAWRCDVCRGAGRVVADTPPTIAPAEISTDNCPRCMATLRRGIALVPSSVAGMEDFAGADADRRGQTFSDGPGQLGAVMKCPECGFSRTV